MLSSALFALTAQITTGAAVYAVGAGVVSMGKPPRRRLVSWVAGARSLRVVWVVSAAASLALVWPLALAGDIPWAVLAAGALPTASCWVLLDSGRLEAQGRRTRARAQARLGGILLGVGAALQIAVALLVGATPESTRVLYLPGLLALGACGWIGLVCGLAGKPRPSCWVAAGLHVAGVLALLAAAGGA